MSKNKQKQTSPDGPVLQIDAEVTRCIRQHARAFMKTEVCGVLIGEERDGAIEVQASIEASNAAQAGTHVTFTQDAWEEIYRVKDQKFPDHRIVGWYHSHPGFGVFLSEHDTFIHRNFFSSPNQVAWVYDPHTDEEGCFGWFKGEIHRIESLSIIDLSGDGEERTPRESSLSSTVESEQEEQITVHHARRTPPPAREKQPLTLLAMNIGGYFCMAIAGFAVSFFLFPSVVGVAVDARTMQPITIEGRPVWVGHVEFSQSQNAIQLVPLSAGPGQLPPQSPPPIAAPASAATPAPVTSPTSPAPGSPTPATNSKPNDKSGRSR